MYMYMYIYIYIYICVYVCVCVCVCVKCIYIHSKGSARQFTTTSNLCINYIGWRRVRVRARVHVCWTPLTPAHAHTHVHIYIYLLHVYIGIAWRAPDPVDPLTNSLMSRWSMDDVSLIYTKISILFCVNVSIVNG